MGNQIEVNSHNNLLSVDDIVSLAIKNGNEKVLDVNVGEGFYTLPLAKATKGRVYAIEEGAAFDKITKIDLDNIELISKEIAKGELKDNSINVTIASQIFARFDDIDELLSNISTKLIDEGRLICLEDQSYKDVRFNKKYCIHDIEEKLIEYNFVIEQMIADGDHYIFVCKKRKNINFS